MESIFLEASVRSLSHVVAKALDVLRNRDNSLQLDGKPSTVNMIAWVLEHVDAKNSAIDRSERKTCFIIPLFVLSILRADLFNCPYRIITSKSYLASSYPDMHNLFVTSRELHIINQQRLRNTRSLRSTRRRELNKNKLDVVTSADGSRESLLLGSEDGRWVVLELARADLLGVADGVVAAAVARDGDVAGGWHGEERAGGGDAAEVEALEAEAGGLGVFVVGSDHGGAGEEFRLEAGAGVTGG